MGKNDDIVIYQDDNGITKVSVRFSNEDLWLRSEADDIEEAEGEVSTEAQRPETDSWVDKRQMSRTSTDVSEEDEIEEDETDDVNNEADDDNKYYTPVDREPDAESPSEESNKSDNTPVYSKDTEEKKDIKDRKVTPVLPKTGTADKLF